MEHYLRQLKKIPFPGEQRMNYTKSLFLIAFFLLLLIHHIGNAQQQPGLTVQDTTKKVHILSNTRNLILQTADDSTRLTIVTGDVKMRQGNALFFCDSCVINNRTNIFEAWGKVHIIDSDTAHVTANHLRYLGNTKLAYLDGNVKLTDGHATLTTPDLEYDMQTNIGTYKNGGKVVNKKTVLNSKEGYYFADLKDVYFKNNVKLRDPAYDIDTDSLFYNTQTRTTKFISQTLIKDSSGRVIKTREGYYNQQTGKAEFGSRPEIIDGNTLIKSDRLALNDSTGIYQAEGNAIIIDTAQGTTIIGGLIFQNKKTEAILATRKPLMIIRQEKDSIYITADTLFSARLTDKFGEKNMQLTETATGRKMITFIEKNKIISRDTISFKPITDSVALIKTKDTTGKTDSLLPPRTKPKMIIAPPKLDTTLATPDSLTAKQDTTQALPDSLLAKPAETIPVNIEQTTDSVKKIEPVVFAEKDSTNRYFEAYRNVRIFSDSLQSVCDSLFYSLKDSVFRLYKDPVVWAQNSQITGDTILLFTKNKKADKVEAFENGFLINRIEEDVYNQVKSARMDGWFTEGNIDSVRAKAYAECIYYIQDEDSAYTGVNQTQSDLIDIYFLNKELEKVVFRTAVTGTLWPIRDKSPGEMQLPGFRWLEERRPKTREEMFE